jgi:hypothetical protein
MVVPPALTSTFSELCRPVKLGMFHSPASCYWVTAMQCMPSEVGCGSSTVRPPSPQPPAPSPQPPAPSPQPPALHGGGPSTHINLQQVDVSCRHPLRKQPAEGGLWHLQGLCCLQIPAGNCGRWELWVLGRGSGKSGMKRAHAAQQSGQHVTL